jgi:hypothetical protein
VGEIRNNNNCIAEVQRQNKGEERIKRLGKEKDKENMEE